MKERWQRRKNLLIRYISSIFKILAGLWLIHRFNKLLKWRTKEEELSLFILDKRVQIMVSLEVQYPNKTICNNHRIFLQISSIIKGQIIHHMKEGTLHIMISMLRQVTLVKWLINKINSIIKAMIIRIIKINNNLLILLTVSSSSTLRKITTNNLQTIKIKVKWCLLKIIKCKIYLYSRPKSSFLPWLIWSRLQ